VAGTGGGRIGNEKRRYEGANIGGGRVGSGDGARNVGSGG
jgi:hypothetical protein